MASPERYDAVVVGVGGIGSAAVYHLAERGLDVLGLERYDVPHAKGSSHGLTRIIRTAYHEDPAYVPLVRRAYELWRELESKTGRDLLYTTGSVAASEPEADPFAGARQACQEHDIDHEVLDPVDLADRVPGLELPAGHRALYQPDGGFLASERCIVAHVEAAHEEGATVHARERVVDWRPTRDGVLVETDRNRYGADRLVVAAGAWTPKLIEALADVAVPERQVLGWFQPDDPARFAPDAFPVFSCAVEEGRFYGTPVFGVPGVKVGKHHHRGETVDPDAMGREPSQADERVLREFADRYLPGGAGPTMRLSVCLITNTPDDDFVIDRLPDHPQVTVAGGFSGHGFKFASVVGEVVADLAVDGDSTHDLSPFAIDRF